MNPFETHSNQILHLDDDPDMLNLVKHYLGSQYNVISLQDPSRCVDELVRSGARMVILDIEMDTYNGLDLLQTIKQLDGGIHVIMLTGLVSMETVLRSMRYGAEACLFKPLYDGYELREVVKATHKKIGRWHASVKDLLSRKKTIQARHHTFSAF